MALTLRAVVPSIHERELRKLSDYVQASRLRHRIRQREYLAERSLTECGLIFPDTVLRLLPAGAPECEECRDIRHRLDPEKGV